MRKQVYCIDLSIQLLALDNLRLNFYPKKQKNEMEDENGMKRKSHSTTKVKYTF